MALDTRRFLELTVLLSGVACASRSEPASPPASALAPSPQAYDGPPPPAPPEVPTDLADNSTTPAVVARGQSCNDTGNVRECDLLTPSCEGGEAAMCSDPEFGMRSKIREDFAQCVKKTERGRCPPRTAARSCLKQAISKGCIDADAEDMCRQLISDCKAAGKKLRYDLATCARIVSAVDARPGSMEWRAMNLELLGPTSEDKSCALDYVLPYYPFGK